MEAEAQLAQAVQASSEGGQLPRGCAGLPGLPKVMKFLAFHVYLWDFIPYMVKNEMRQKRCCDSR